LELVAQPDGGRIEDEKSETPPVGNGVPEEKRGSHADGFAEDDQAESGISTRGSTSDAGA
jgi:hypothetical protein